MTDPTPHADIIENLRVIVDSAGEVIDDDDALAAQFAIDALTRTADALTAVTAERDQARQMLADAPHDKLCIRNGWYSEEQQQAHADQCNCWKAGMSA